MPDSISLPKKHIVVAIVLTILYCSNSTAQDTIRITDFGYQPGSGQNAVAYVKQALELCKTKKHPVLVFSKGRYDFFPQGCAEKKYYESNTVVIPFRKCPILLEKQHGLTIDGMNADFIYHGILQPVTIDSSTDITVKNLQIDWDIPLNAQARVASVTDQYIDLEMNTKESPYTIENNKLVFVGEGWRSPWWDAMEFDKDSHLIVPQTGDASCLGKGFDKYKAVELQAGLVRLLFPFTRKPAVGNYLVLRHSTRDHAGCFIFNSSNINLKHINIYQTAGLGVLSQFSMNLSFNEVNCIPNPKKSRYFCGHDDGLHFSNCKGNIELGHCRFQGLMDDPINVHGTSVKVIQLLDKHQLLCQFMHEQSIGMHWATKGDTINFIENQSMNSLGNAIVQSFQLTDSIHFILSFKQEIPTALVAGNALENLSQTPNVHIHHCYFGSNRARGILVSTPGKVVIENNIFESSGSAILIAGDANEWYESGAVKEVLIRNNTFNDPCLSSLYQFCEGIISIYPSIPHPNSENPFHRNIRIINNKFYPFDFPVLYAKSTEGLQFSNNTIQRSYRFQPFHYRKYMITLESCKQAVISGNKLEGFVLGRNIQLLSMPATEINLDPHQGISIAGNRL